MGPAYLKEGNRPKLLGKEEGCVLAKNRIFFSLSLQMLTKILAGSSFSFYSLDILDIRYQRGPGKVTLLCFPSFCFLDVSPIILSNTDKDQILTNLYHHSLKEGVGERRKF